ncbi:transcription factor bHLH36-like [Coffea arabica]|uniref:Transcription factor bHLH36-like n=1 Tax=Coffea arabica TaxID=13443 RepID=A0A6P6VPT6_COFAR|nr:transcription factor bHLH36-like [Coffea arabica]
MYPLQQGNELENQNPCRPCQPDKILNDLVTLESTASLPPATSITGKKHHHRRFLPAIQQENKKQDHEDTTTTNSNQHKLKRILHRDIERQRRREMANLYASLRSLLPLDYVKGKRAISDHMQEAVNYIKCLQKNINQLGSRRDRLMIPPCNLSSTFSFSSGNRSTSADSRCLRDCGAIVRVSQGGDGVEVLISISSKEETFPISRVLKMLLGEGLDVVSCVSTATNEIKVHKILAEVTDGRKSIDTLALQHQLMNAINPPES